MYNSEEKQKYIDFKESQATLPENYLNRLFTDTEEIEYSMSTDVSGWDEPAIIEFYRKKKSPSLHSLIVMNGRLAEYVDFLNRDKSDKKQNKFYNITTDILRSCIDEEKAMKRYIGVKEFYNDLEDLDNAVDKFVLTALFEGIKGKGFEQIWRLQLNDIKTKEVTLHDGKILDLMDSHLYHYAHESADCFYYYTYGKTDVAIKMDGAPDQIIKMTNKKQYLEVSDDPVMVKRQDKNIFRKFERAADFIGWTEIRPRTLLLSGQIEYTRRTAEEYGMSIEEVVKTPKLFRVIQDRFIRIADHESFLDATTYVLSQSSSSG